MKGFSRPVLRAFAPVLTATLFSCSSPSGETGFFLEEFHDSLADTAFVDSDFSVNELSSTECQDFLLNRDFAMDSASELELKMGRSSLNESMFSVYFEIIQTAGYEAWFACAYLKNNSNEFSVPSVRTELDYPGIWISIPVEVSSRYVYLYPGILRNDRRLWLGEADEMAQHLFVIYPDSGEWEYKGLQ